mgnify:CR=1 FL=1
MTHHLVLLGDSIFDNRAYVKEGHSVIEHLWKLSSQAGQATLLARDGDITEDVIEQLSRLPSDMTHLALSVGGNDALGAIPLMSMPAQSVMHALSQLTTVQRAFHQSYRKLANQLQALGKPLAVCTVYESVPGLTEELRTALSLFNDVITREALTVGATVIDLRRICTEAGDYSSQSPIEPSEIGGQKIAMALYQWMSEKQ